MKKIKSYLKDFKLYRNKEELRYGSLFLAVFMTFIWIFVTTVPINNQLPKTFVIEEGSSLKMISTDLKKQGFIRSKTVFNSLVILKAGDGRIVSGEYLFSKPITFFDLIERLTTGDYGIDVKQIRIPEGVTILEMGRLLESSLSNFDKEAFYQLAEGKEGYLFPDTYLFPENLKAHQVLEILENTFKDKTKDLTKQSSISLEEIVIMASIIEKEADAESKQEVSNILWHRMSIDMPLQVDATFVYSIGKGTFDLHVDDLADEDNLYNTYVRKGLPPTPISNPSLEALEAAANPESTDYLYFLTGRDGNMYYAETFEEHKLNKQKYL